MRWVHVARLAVAASILLAAVFVWTRATPADTLVATLAFAGAVVWTAGALLLARGGAASEPSAWLVGAHVVVDLLLVTAVVHVTGAATSQFVALYVLVVAYAALLLPAVGGALAALAAAGLFALDATASAEVGAGGVALQAIVVGGVAATSGWIGWRLRQAGAGGRRLADALTRATLEAADVLRAIRSGIVTVDRDGVLLYANPAAAALLGLPLHERLAEPVLDEIAARAPELAALLRDASLGTRTTRAEGRILLDDVRRIGVTTTASKGSDGRGAGTAIFSDITDSKRVDALRGRAERLEAVAELSASLAHEIRNPLASIRSAVEQLARRSAPGDEDAQTLAALVVRESDRLSDLLGEFLDFARARVRRVAPVDLESVARAAARVASLQLTSTPGVAVDVACDGGGPFVVDGDEELLHRALLNLVLNAVQATRADGQARVVVRRATERESPSGVAVDVVDDGPGIDASIVDRLFDPFFTTKAGGTGLGLAIVHRVAEAHRGVVLVDAGGEGRGARFTLLLPTELT